MGYAVMGLFHSAGSVRGMPILRVISTYLRKRVATIMKHWALISLLFLLSAECAGATIYLYSGRDAYGLGLSYPAYGSPLSFASFAVGNNTTSVSQVLLRATIFRPEFELQRSRNRSGYYHPILPMWSQFTFYLPFSSMQNFLREDWKPAASDYDTPAIRQFMQEDGYREGVEAHNDPDRMGLNHFLDDDEPPGRPLL
ncbi:MAG: hypothetical protein NTU95_01780 [Methanothrix sp.]|nr:hypothetical protein [Methanothrix sp.]